MRFLLLLAKKVRQFDVGPVNRLGRWTLQNFQNIPLFLPRRSTISFDSINLSYSPRYHFYPIIFSMVTGRYEPFTMDLFKKSIKPTMVILDIGAHIGIYTICAACRLGSEGKVYAFEPDPRNLPFLEANIKKNGFADRVTVIPKAVSSQTTKTSFYLAENTGVSSIFGKNDKTKTETHVEMIALDDFLEESVIPDVIKIDIEGAEFLALEGMKRVISRANSKLVIFIELNPYALSFSGSSCDTLVKLLDDIGFEIKLIDEENCRLEEIPSDLPGKIANTWGGYANLYCVRRS